MKVEKAKKTNRVKDFFSRYIFYNVPKEEKDYIRRTTMNSDHAIFKIMLFAIFILQLIMILYTCMARGFKFDARDVGYLASYLSLAFTMVIASALIEILRNKDKPLGYFILVSVVVNIFYIWALAITILDSWGPNRFPVLATFSYVSLALTSFLMLEPWVFVLDVVGYVTLLNILFAVIPELSFYPSVVITSVSVALLTALIAIINFARRLNSMNLQKQVLELNEILKGRAYFDDLTGVHNRRYLTEHIDDAIYFGSNSTGVLMFDIDEFKEVNDTYGHQNGDVCLKIIGEVLNDLTAQHEDSYSVRFGGEEFLIHFKHIKKDNLLETAEILRSKIENMDFTLLDGKSIHLTISLGAAVGKVGKTYTALINKADANLYIAKNSGKNRVYFE